MLRLLVPVLSILFSISSISLGTPHTYFYQGHSSRSCTENHLVSTGNGYSVFAPKCSTKDLATEGQKFQISKNFAATEGLARRVHFWGKIYSFYSIRDYVIHSSVYPEVIIESVHLDASKDERIKPKRTLKYRLSRAKQILMKMHRQGGASLDEEEIRLASSTKHINNKDKFKEIAESLRVQRGQKEFIERGIRTSSRYLPHITPYFKEIGIPEELAFVAFVESSFNLKAISKVGASGVYQIMPFIARKMMLLNHKIDERRDPIKSGQVAAKLFKDNLKLTGNWPLAVTAYNHGPFGIRRAVKRAGTDNLENLIENYSGKGFGFASKNFYCEFLAALYVVSNHPKFLIYEGSKQNQLEYTEVVLPYSYRVKTVLKKYEISRSELKRLNPDILRRVVNSNNGILPKGYRLKLPIKKKGPIT